MNSIVCYRKYKELTLLENSRKDLLGSLQFVICLVVTEVIVEL